MKSLTPRQIERMQRVAQARLESTPETWAKKHQLSPYVQMYRRGDLSPAEFYAAERLRTLHNQLFSGLAPRTMAAVSSSDGTSYRAWRVQGGLHDLEAQFDLRAKYRKWYSACRNAGVNPEIVLDCVVKDTTIETLAKERGAPKAMIRVLIKRGLGAWGSGTRTGRTRIRAWRAFGDALSGRRSATPLPALVSMGSQE